ncbi:MAG: MFS transporter [Actinomycetota bacterium]|nr:MFS transporter [Actinomycetota bacterium]
MSNEETHKSKSKLALAVIASAQLMIVLDITIVNVALPSIQRALSFSTSSLAWVVDAYTLVFGGLLLLGGRSGDIFGRRKMFTVGVLLFAGASLLGGLASSSALLIAARALQGIGGAIASPTALALVASNFEGPKERTEALTIFAAVSAAGASLGLILGALLTQYLSWRWVFFVNTPIALILSLSAGKILKESEKQKVPSDLLGAFTSVVGVASLVYGFIHAAASGWTNSITVASFIVAAISLVGFVLRERSAKRPLLELFLFENRNRTGAYLVMFLVSAALFSLWFFLTQFLQDVLGYSPLKTGFAFLPMTLTVMVLARNGAWFMKKFGALPMMIYGPAASATALFIFSNLNSHSSYLTVILPTLLLNATGLGMTFSSVFPTAMTEIDPRRAGIGSAMVSVSQQVGGSLGISVLATVAEAGVASKVRLLSTSGVKSPLAIKVASEISGWTNGFRAAALMALAGTIVSVFAIRSAKRPQGAPSAIAIAVEG